MHHVLFPLSWLSPWFYSSSPSVYSPHRNQSDPAKTEGGCITSLKTLWWLTMPSPSKPKYLWDTHYMNCLLPLWPASHLPLTSYLLHQSLYISLFYVVSCPRAVGLALPSAWNVLPQIPALLTPILPLGFDSSSQWGISDHPVYLDNFLLPFPPFISSLTLCTF